MSFESFKRGAKIVGALLIAANLTGCSKTITEGNFGMEKYWGGSYNKTAIEPGTYFFDDVFDSWYEIYGKETMIKIQDIRPKDKNGVMLKDLDLNVSIKAIPEGAIKFFLKTGDLAKAEDGIYKLGLKVLEKDAQSTFNKTMRLFTSEEALDKQDALELQFKKDLQAELDRLYGPKTFEVTEVKIANIQVAEAIEEKIQAIATVQAEQERNNATQKVLFSRQEAMTGEANVLKHTAEKTGLSIDQLLQYEMIKAIREAPSGTVKVNVDATTKQTGPKK